MVYEGDSDSNYSWGLWNSPPKAGRESQGAGDERKNRDWPDPGWDQLDYLEELIKLAIIRIPVKTSSYKTGVKKIII